MAKYIDAEKIPFVTGNTPNEPLDYVRRYAIDNMPAADVVEVVRCVECKHSRSDEFEPLWCYVSETCDPVKEDHFCGYGERRDE